MTITIYDNRVKNNWVQQFNSIITYKYTKTVKDQLNRLKISFNELWLLSQRTDILLDRLHIT